MSQPDINEACQNTARRLVEEALTAIRAHDAEFPHEEMVHQFVCADPWVAGTVRAQVQESLEGKASVFISGKSYGAWTLTIDPNPLRET